MTKPREKVSEVQERVKQGFEREYYDMVYRDQYFAFTGIRLRGPTTKVERGGFPVYPSTRPLQREPGKTNRVLVTALIAMSRAMSRDIDPSFPQLDETTREVRRQWWLTRHSQFDWRSQIAAAFLDGDAFGVGCVLVGKTTDPDSGKDVVDLQHIPILQVLWDRHARTPTKSRWVCLIHYMDPYDAAVYFNKPFKEIDARAFDLSNGAQDVKGYRVVRVFEYLSMGIGGSRGTRMLFLHDIDNHVKTEDMDYPKLPVAWFVGLTPPGHSRPVGRVQMQMATQMQLNKYEAFLGRMLDYGWAIDILDASRIDGNDLAAHARGDKLPYLRGQFSKDGSPLWQRMPAKEMPRVFYDGLNYYERRYDEESGLSDMDRGGLSATARSATEIATLDARLSLNQAYSTRQTAQAFSSIVEVTVMVGKEVDEAPCEVDIYGTNVTLNDDEDPRMRSKFFLEEKSSVLIGTETLTADDDKLKRQADKADMMEWQKLGLVGDTIDKDWYTERLLRLSNVENIKEAMISKEKRDQMMAAAQAQAQAQAQAEAQAQQTRQSGGPSDPYSQAVKDQRQLAGAV